MLDEGYTKYRCRWTPGPASEAPVIDELIAIRQQLYRAGLIGVYVDSGIGFGNISALLYGGPEFLISGTQTGHHAQVSAEHFATVTRCDIAGNEVDCSGPLQASSEAMTHAAIYALGSDIHSVVHIHSRPLWVGLKDRLPTTRPGVAYGTTAMAEEFGRLYNTTRFAEIGVAVMAGHEQGLISFGCSVKEAANRLLSLEAGSS